MVNVTAKSDASTRTKNRIREHGKEGFRLEGRAPNKDNLNEEVILLRCLHECPSSGWLGWLPLNEVNVEEVVTP
jgi:hypothetical protein